MPARQTVRTARDKVFGSPQVTHSFISVDVTRATDPCSPRAIADSVLMALSVRFHTLRAAWQHNFQAQPKPTSAPLNPADRISALTLQERAPPMLACNETG
jgi:hypothetical protein